MEYSIIGQVLKKKYCGFGGNNIDRTWQAGLLYNRHFPGAGTDWGFSDYYITITVNHGSPSTTIAKSIDYRIVYR